MEKEVKERPFITVHETYHCTEVARVVGVHVVAVAHDATMTMNAFGRQFQWSSASRVVVAFECRRRGPCEIYG